MFAAALPAAISAAGSLIGGALTAHSAGAAAADANRANLENQRSVNEANILATRESNLSNQRNVDVTNAMNAEINRQNLSFQERMSNTAYQRAHDDMLKAGINPILAYSQGGASTPSGSSVAAQPARNIPAHSVIGAAQLPSVPDYGRGISSAAEAASQVLDNQNKLLLSKQIMSQIALNAASAQKVQADTHLLSNEGKVSDRDTNVELSTFGKVINYVNRTLSPVGSAIGSMVGGAKLFKGSHIPIRYDRDSAFGSFNTSSGKFS